jgi:hypothetical protein
MKAMCWKWHQTSALAERSRGGRGEAAFDHLGSDEDRRPRPQIRTTGLNLNFLNRRMRTRMSGGVAGESGHSLPLCRLCPCPSSRPLMCACCAGGHVDPARRARARHLRRACTP